LYRLARSRSSYPYALAVAVGEGDNKLSILIRFVVVVTSVPHAAKGIPDEDGTGAPLSRGTVDPPWFDVVLSSPVATGVFVPQ
jgi:hypothetical protein